MALVCTHYAAGGRRVVVVVVGTSRILIGPHSPAPSIPSDLCQVVVSPLAGNSTGMSLHLPRARGNFRVTNIFCSANPFCSAKTESVSGRSVPICADAARPLTTHAWWFPWTLIFRCSADRARFIASVLVSWFSSVPTEEKKTTETQGETYDLKGFRSCSYVYLCPRH